MGETNKKGVGLFLYIIFLNHKTLGEWNKAPLTPIVLPGDYFKEMTKPDFSIYILIQKKIFHRHKKTTKHILSNKNLMKIYVPSSLLDPKIIC